MTAVLSIRALIGDLQVTVEESLSLDGGQMSAYVKFAPVVPGSVVVPDLSEQPSLDAQSGMLLWNEPPALGTYVVRYATVQLLDSTIESILAVQTTDDPSSDDLKLAAANALDTIASSQALIQKQIKLLDLQTDGPNVAKALREHAKSLRAQVGDTSLDERTFDIAEQINDQFGFTEKVYKDFLRERG